MKSPATPQRAMKSNQFLRTECQKAFSEYVLEEFGATSKASDDPKLWRAFRAGWYARQGRKK